MKRRRPSPQPSHRTLVRWDHARGVTPCAWSPTRGEGALGPVIAYLSLGSNIGDRLEHIRSALTAIRDLPHTRLGRVSSIYQTSPVGVRGQKTYLNCCAEIRTVLSPMGLLVELKRLEAAAGRRPARRRWRPRKIDIDIVFYGRFRSTSRFLTLPHPRALRRKFVLAPLAELRGGWIPPAAPRRTLGTWLSRLNDPTQNVTVYMKRLPSQH